jgi:hypothetical protein
MSNSNPYAAPTAKVADIATEGLHTPRLNRIASGQRLMIYSILVSIFAMALQASVGSSASIVTIGASILSIVGVVRLSGALGSGAVVRWLSAIAMVIPLINLLIMLRFSSLATKALRSGGYKVGLFGASQRVAGA